MESEMSLLFHGIEAAAIVLGLIWHFARMEARIAVMERLLRILIRRAGLESEVHGD